MTEVEPEERSERQVAEAILLVALLALADRRYPQLGPEQHADVLQCGIRMFHAATVKTLSTKVLNAAREGRDVLEMLRNAVEGSTRELEKQRKRFDLLIETLFKIETSTATPPKAKSYRSTGSVL